MSEEFLESYNKLDVNNKRNELNNEMRVTLGVLKGIKASINIDNSIEDIKNYNANEDYGMSEDEMLTFFYEDFFAIQKEIMDIADNLFNK